MHVAFFTHFFLNRADTTSYNIIVASNVNVRQSEAEVARTITLSRTPNDNNKYVKVKRNRLAL
jgi:hypothetical protein